MAIDKVLRGIPFLRQELTKIFMKRAANKSGIMTVPFKNKKLQLDIEDRLQKYILDAQKQGVDLDMVSNENLKYTINLNENVDPISRAISADSPEGRKITEALLGKQKAPVVDINTGKTMDTSQGIMGGKSVAELMESGQVTKGARGMKKSKKVQDREMFKNSNLNKTDAQIKAEIEASNKKSLSKMETNNFALNTITKIKSMSPMDAMKEANLVAGKKGRYSNLDNNQVKKIIDDTEDHIFERDIPEEDFAAGGIARANFVGGGMGRRAFMKLMGSVGAGIGAAKSGIFSGFGKGAGKEVAKEVVKQSASTPPPYFFKLAEKIKKLGSDTIPTNDRTIAKSLKSKDGKSDYILEEDVTSGDTIIKKVNKEGDDMISDVQIMEFRKGEDVITKDGKAIKTPNEYEEVTETNSRIYKDNYNASDYVDGIEEIEMKKIIDEVDNIPVPKASGGIARMLGE